MRVPKALFHPDGVLYVIWHDTQDAYCPVFSDEDVPPNALELNLRDDYATNHYKLIWRPIRMTATAQEETVTAPYDADTGEQF